MTTDKAFNNKNVKTDETFADERRVTEEKANGFTPEATFDDKPARDRASFDDEAQQQSPEVVKPPQQQRPDQQSADEDTATQLFEDQEAERFRAQWRDLQAGFVDEPKSAVRDAEALVSQMLDSLTSHIAEQKQALVGEHNGDDTEQLRVTLRRYRVLFDQILSV
jgi:hypothetical protein